MNNFIQDLRYAFWMLLKHRGFTAAAVLALGLGIRGKTAIFTVINSVLLRPLPYPEPESLVAYRCCSSPNLQAWRRCLRPWGSMA